MIVIGCVECSVSVHQSAGATVASVLNELEAHIAGHHLDYFPYGCVYCGHWMATESMAHYHADRKQHLPRKIRENCDVSKEQRLHDLLRRSVCQVPELCLPGAESNTVQLQAVQRLVALNNFLTDQRSRTNLIGTPRAQSVPNPTQSSPISNETIQQLISPTPAPSNPEASVPSTNAVSMASNNQSGAGANSNSNPNKRALTMDDVHRMDRAGTRTSSDGSAMCDWCLVPVPVREQSAHVSKHLLSRPMAACNYCNYKGRNSVAVRTHITWRHPQRSTALGIGVRDISGVSDSYEQMYRACFMTQRAASNSHSTSSSPIDGGSKRRKAAKPTKCMTGEHENNVDNSEKQPDALQSFVEQLSLLQSRQLATSMGEPSKTQSPLKRPQPLLTSPSGSTNDSPTQEYSRRGVELHRSRTGRVRLRHTCALCLTRVLDSVASSHVYDCHISQHDMIQCPHCAFGSTYAVSDVKKHILKAHPGTSAKVLDHRPERHDLYIEWRNRCFPHMGIGNKQPRGGRQAAAAEMGQKEGQMDWTLDPNQIVSSQGLDLSTSCTRHEPDPLRLPLDAELGAHSDSSSISPASAVLPLIEQPVHTESTDCRTENIICGIQAEDTDNVKNEHFHDEPDQCTQDRQAGTSQEFVPKVEA